MVELHTGTTFPAVSLKSLLAAAMMKHTERWNGTGAPTQFIPQAASFILSACKN
jgi:response regulator RpfG family c-di-GMP phosphodiesterase